MLPFTRCDDNTEPGNPYTKDSLPALGGKVNWPVSGLSAIWKEMDQIAQQRISRKARHIQKEYPYKLSGWRPSLLGWRPSVLG